MEFKKTSIIQYPTDIDYQFVPLSDFEADKSTADDIAKICNEPLIYNRLFKKVCENEAYPAQKATEFLKWAKTGFEDSTHFVFLIVNQSNQPAGAIDIKQNDLNSAEIGYWLSKEHTGLMTNAVIELVKQAKENGFKSLYGMCEIDNLKSQAVLERANFENQGQCRRNDKEYFKYSIFL
ncbi:MAG: GNAT family N-acetyltransferase [Rhodospirillales bacterium]|nr:GNAT family N-acetyltransferase [Rhodospirillales bacterium]